ncbi:MAG TPA: molybdenum cofactor guanylyltransferase [Candidatus Sulfotelmatobacter sp.]|nr:molybdenum cofactor guanylyltransferase [Candidatus Sulfotelmatobacter sp.]
MRTLGILLAGGRGSRLAQGSPKAKVLLEGETLFERAARELSAVCDEVVVVLPEDFELATSLPRVNDLIAAGGPLSALVAGLEARAFERALALGVDFPRLTASKLTRLLAAHGDHPATVPAPGGRPQPLTAVYSRTARLPLRQAFESGARAVTPAVMALGPRMLADHELRALGLAPGDFADLDRPEDLAAFESRARREA